MQVKDVLPVALGGFGGFLTGADGKEGGDTQEKMSRPRCCRLELLCGLFRFVDGVEQVFGLTLDRIEQPRD